MKKITTEQKDKLRKARKLISNVIQGYNFEHDETTGVSKTASHTLVDAENLLSDIREEMK